MTGSPDAAQPKTRHVWVQRQFHAAAQDPGLVLEWRHRHEGWEALVTYPDTTTTQQRIVTEWIPAARLIPVPWRPGSGTAYG